MFDFGASAIGRSANLNSEAFVVGVGLVDPLDLDEPFDDGLGSAGGWGLG